jgi:hypothetical protein
MTNLCKEKECESHSTGTRASPGLPIDIGVVGSTSIANCSRFGVPGVGTYDRSEMGDSCLTTGCVDAEAGLPVPELSNCKE